MKKSLLISVFVLLITMFFVSCSGGVPQGNHLFFIVTNWNAGPGVKNADVAVFDSETGDFLGTGKTNDLGVAAVTLTQIPERVDVSVIKATHARSLVVGLKSAQASTNMFPIILPNALLNPNPFNEDDPVVEIEIGETNTSIRGPFEITVDVNADRDVSFIYQPLLGRIAGDASVTSDVNCIEGLSQATFEISPTGFDGECALYSTVYDANNNRVLRVDYLEIEATDPGQVQMYKPMTFVDFSEFFISEPLENIRSYTRRVGIEFRNTNRISPEGSNLWTHLYWADWSSLNAYHQSGEHIYDLGDRPDGYNVYRSPDGITYELFAFVSEQSLNLKAKTIMDSVVSQMDPNALLNANPLYKDGSPFIHPGYPIYYRITAVYGTLESEPTELGSVIPLDAFDVELISPDDQADSVSLNPDFEWRPNKALSSDEGVVVYNYGLYLYDSLQRRDNLIVPVIPTTAPNPFFLFETDSSDSLSVHFSPNTPEQDWGCIWKRYEPLTDNYQAFEPAALRAQGNYEWEISLAFASVKDDDSRAYSIASDYKHDGSGWNIDPFGPLEPSEKHEFTTVAE